MKFWRNKQREEKAAPVVGAALYVAGTSGASWMAKEAYATEGYSQNPVAYACISKIATSAASLNYKLISHAGSEPQEILTSPLFDLLDNPNPHQDWSAFIDTLVNHYLIHGNAYVLRLPVGKKQPTQIWLLRPDRMKVEHNARGEVTGYIYSAGAGQVKYQRNVITGECDVKHVAKFNPTDDYLGLSSMAPAARSIDIVNEAMEWNKSLLQNGARPSGAYVVNAEHNNGKLSDEQFTRLREQLQADSVGSSNAGKPLLLEGGIDWKEMSLSPKDMEFESNMWASARMIATAYGVPPQLINIPGESTYSNYSEAKIAFWQDTVLPLAKSLFAQLSAFLCPAYGNQLYIEVDAEHIDAMEEKRWMKFDRLERVTFMTMEEKRIAAGLDPVPSQGVLLVDAGKVPLDILSDGSNVI
jgi:HK97 family phage portal protein